MVFRSSAARAASASLAGQDASTGFAHPTPRLEFQLTRDWL
jgi:hypothetical protein